MPGLDVQEAVVTYSGDTGIARRGSRKMMETTKASLGGGTNTPLYQKLAAKLRSEIERGSPGPNELLPSERDLAVQYAMSRDTVRKAVRLLEEQGLLYSDQGRGTFVAPSAVREMAQFLESFSQDTKQRGGVPGQTIILIEQTPATIAIAGVLEISPHQTVTRVKRIRTIDGRAVGLHDAYIALPAGSILTAAELEEAGSLYKLLGSRFDLAPAEALESIGSIAANIEDAASLNVAVGSPLLLCERIALSERRQPIEYCEMKYVSTYRYTARIRKSNQMKA
jgi:GntR family transcriptional regulator